MGNVTIIGGGASGLTAAITAASAGARVTLIEQNDRVGKKILSTGNGRCNYTNLRQVKYFRELGIFPKNREGYLYPNSDQASSVLDVLRMECRRLHAEIRTDCRCTEIRPKKNGFRLKTTSGEFPADCLTPGAFDFYSHSKNGNHCPMIPHIPPAGRVSDNCPGLLYL